MPAGGKFPLISTFSSPLQLAIMIFTPTKMQHRADQLAITMIILGILRMVATFIQRTMLGIAGEKLTKRVRGMLFKSILNQVQTDLS